MLSVLVAPSAVFYFHLLVIRSTSSRIRSLLQFASALSCKSIRATSNYGKPDNLKYLRFWKGPKWYVSLAFSFGRSTFSGVFFSCFVFGN